MPGISRLITATRRSSMSSLRGRNDKRGSIIRRMARAALVLSGGGLLGLGWELGVLRGLQDGGVAMGRFDQVIGTSAGAVSGAIAASGAPLEALSPVAERDRQFAAMAQQMNPD